MQRGGALDPLRIGIAILALTLAAYALTVWSRRRGRSRCVREVRRELAAQHADAADLFGREAAWHSERADAAYAHAGEESERLAAWYEEGARMFGAWSDWHAARGRELEGATPLDPRAEEGRDDARHAWEFEQLRRRHERGRRLRGEDRPAGPRGDEGPWLIERRGFRLDL